MTQEKLHTLFDYQDGKLIWKVDRGNNKTKGKEAGAVNESGYRFIKIDNKLFRAHRLIWTYHNQELPEFIDHINGDKLDNRIENLRPVSKSQNNTNRPKQVNNTSGHKGVYWNKQKSKWQAKAVNLGRQYHFGFHSDKRKAIDAYNLNVKKLCGEYAHINNTGGN